MIGKMSLLKNGRRASVDQIGKKQALLVIVVLRKVSIVSIC